VHTEICPSNEFCALPKKDLHYSALAQIKGKLEKSEIREVWLHCTYNTPLWLHGVTTLKCRMTFPSMRLHSVTTENYIPTIPHSRPYGITTQKWVFTLPLIGIHSVAAAT
jgi:hypothetical protein